MLQRVRLSQGASVLDSDVERWKSQLLRMAELDVSSDICNDHLRTMLLREHHRLKAAVRQAIG